MAPDWFATAAVEVAPPSCADTDDVLNDESATVMAAKRGLVLTEPAIARTRRIRRCSAGPVPAFGIGSAGDRLVRRHQPFGPLGREPGGYGRPIGTAS